jgi:hypothetical protein
MKSSLAEGSVVTAGFVYPHILDYDANFTIRDIWYPAVAATLSMFGGEQTL